MEQNSPWKQSQIKSFAVAFRGLKILFANERNFRIHMAFAFLAVIAGIFFKIRSGEWIAVLLLIALVMAAEALNTCIEYICNYISPQYHPAIKTIKDIAAGAVLLCAIMAVIVGCIIFVPYILTLI